MSARRPVEVRIDRLVLTGLGAGSGERIGHALCAELERLVAGGEHWPGLCADRAFASAGAVTLVAGTSAEATGRLIARAVYEELGA